MGLSSGLEMMLRSLGLDPAEIQKNVGQIGDLVVAIDHRLGDIALQQQAILSELLANGDRQLLILKLLTERENGDVRSTNGQGDQGTGKPGIELDGTVGSGGGGA